MKIFFLSDSTSEKPMHTHPIGNEAQGSQGLLLAKMWKVGASYPSGVVWGDGTSIPPWRTTWQYPSILHPGVPPKAIHMCAQGDIPKNVGGSDVCNFEKFQTLGFCKPQDNHKLIEAYFFNGIFHSSSKEWRDTHASK